MIALESTAYLGPARVGVVARHRVQLIFPDQKVWSRLALAYPYQPVAGDSVLVAGQEEQWYVIGVLEGSGKTSFVAPGDIEFSAPRGEISMAAAQGVRIHGPSVRIVAEKLEMLAHSVCEKFVNVRRWVRDALYLRAGSSRMVVESTHRLQARRIVERATEDVNIDGRKIHLG